ncbi:MAG: ferritin-like domain-containing protein [Hymenobacter sp.]|nr:MAG: ferritin-like domain-containing protein [Hymenobacter sp.]
MNFFQILSEIEKVDPEVYDRLDSRRRVFKNMAGMGQKLSAAALPLFVSSVFNKVYAQTPAGLSVANVLNFALKLEYLEMYFYQARTGITSQLSSVNSAALATIATDEANHVKFLTGALGTAAIPNPTAAAFDFTAKGTFPTALTSAATYLAVAQSLEDTGVRAYKGAAPLTTVMADKNVLTAALNIHSIEARHASHIRSMRRGGSLATNATPSNSVAVAPYSAQPKSWISGTDSGGAGGTATAPVYGKGNDGADSTGKFATYGATNQVGTTAGVTFLAEDNVVQGGVTLSPSTITSITFPTGTTAFSEAFDEGLDVGTVATIANLFSVSGTYFN